MKIRINAIVLAILLQMSIASAGWSQAQKVDVEHNHNVNGRYGTDPLIDFFDTRRQQPSSDLFNLNPGPSPAELELLEEKALLLREQRLLLKEQRRALQDPATRLAEDVQEYLPEIERFLTNGLNAPNWLKANAEEKRERFQNWQLNTWEKYAAQRFAGNEEVKAEIFKIISERINDDINRTNENVSKNIASDMPTPPFTISFAPMNIPLRDYGGHRTLMIAFDIATEDSKLADAIYAMTPQIKDIIILLLSSLSYNDIVTTDGKIRLRNRMQHRIISQCLQTGHMTMNRDSIKIHFSEFTVQ